MRRRADALSALLRRIEMPLTHLLLIGVGIIWIYPFLWMVSAAFKTTAEMFGGGLNLIPKEPTLDNFVRAWKVANFRTYFFNTVTVTVSVVALVVTWSSMTGYAFGRYDFPGKKLFMGAIVATLFLPTGYTIIPTFELIKALGLLNTLWGVILAMAGGAHVLFILLFTGFFSSLPQDLEDAARIDGCGFVRTFWNVMLPLAKPVIATAVIMRFMWSWNAFFIPLVFTLGKPELRTLGVGMFAFVAEYATDWTGMAAAATISLIPIIAVFLALQRYFVEGVAGAIKG
ncbi:MAG: carbohydrate ABC transporter permease [Chloroflexi bacterium]|nr:carbohydrate ABC transporter permease [Chloroflexota bacterium]